MALYNTSDYKLIYIFSISDDAHKGLVKVGEATIHTTLSLDDLAPNCQALRDAADKGRIKDYTFTAGIKINLLWAELAIRIKEDFYQGNKITTLQGFRDHDVHNVLKNSGIKTSFPNGIKNREWFECDGETAKNAIIAVKNGKDFLAECDKEIKKPETPIQLRDEQREAVKKTLDIFQSGDNMLWNCKMRFGKTLTAYELIKNGKYQKTIVVTHRPVVEQGWEEDHGKLFGSSSSHIFMKKQNLSYSEDYYDYNSDIKNDTALRNAKTRGDYFTYFASMQDLRGSKRAGGKFDKNNAVFDMDWDLIIYDEAHEGKETELGKTVQSLLEETKNGKKPKILELSGTPYNIIDKFGDNVYTWDYVMEQRAKEEWDYKHPNEFNPYADMPKMNIFTFDMSEAIATSYRYETETSAFNFREFFRVWTGETEKDYRPIPEDRKIGDFVHEEDVRSFLNLITTESEDTKYPFATDEYRKEFKHTFWMVPGVKEAKALSSVLKTHPVFMHYQIVNVAGEGDEELPYDNALKLVQDAIKQNAYTITISCGKLTTGVTVREWTAVMMLTGSATTDAKGYMQTIFRVQSAGQIDGKQKENCYVFDFAPDRALKVISDSHSLTKKGKTSDDKFKEVLTIFMNYCPVIAINGTKMEPYNANSLMRQIKRISVDAAIKSGFEDDSIYKVDAGIVMDERDKEFFEALKARLNAHSKSKQEKQVTIADNGLSDEEYEKAVAIERKPAKNLTPEELELREKLKAQRKQQQAFFALLRNISIRLPLLIYGADVPLSESLPLAKFTEIVDDESWKEFMPTDVDKELFKRSIKYFDEDVLMAAGLRIRRLTKQADEYPPTERIKRITEIIGHFRNPDKETVLTPWRAVNMHMSDTIGGYCFLNEYFDTKEPLEEPRYVQQGEITEDLFNNAESKILEINSKSGLYPLYIAYSLYKKQLPKKEEDLTFEEQSEIWNKVLQNRVFVLCKTTMAQKITKRTLAGFTETRTNTHYQPHLIERMQEDIDWVVRKITNPTIWGKEGERMRFDAIIGNPPYQGVNHQQIYPYFYLTSIKTSSKYVSLIFPTGWQEPKNANNLSKLNNEEIKADKQIVKIDNKHNVFPGITGAEWVNVLLWQKGYDNGLEGKQNIYIDGKFNKIALLPWDNSLIEKPNEIKELAKIVIATEGFDNLQKSTSVRKPYGLSTDVVDDYKKYGLEPLNDEKTQDDDIIVYCKSNVIKYISKDYKLPKISTAFNKYKVFVAYAWGNMSEQAGLGGAFSDIIIAKPKTICTETYLESGCFDDFSTAKKHAKYLMTKFARALLYVNKYSQHSTTAWGAVPIQDYSESWWDKSISEIDKELIKKYNIPQNIAEYINKNIQTKTESNIINFNKCD